VDLGEVRPSGRPPEVEDHTFDALVEHPMSDYGAVEFWKLLCRTAKGKLADLFGPALVPQRRGCAVAEGAGSASLGCLRPASRPKLEINHWGKLRVRVSDGTFDVDLSVTDLRFYEEDQQTVRAALVEAVQERIEEGVPVVLSLGLARAFTVNGDSERRHWLQLNNVHLEDDPAWQAT
jgi:hypothetical protein